jgi:hypothetical protein
MIVKSEMPIEREKNMDKEERAKIEHQKLPRKHSGAML